MPHHLTPLFDSLKAKDDRRSKAKLATHLSRDRLSSHSPSRHLSSHRSRKRGDSSLLGTAVKTVTKTYEQAQAEREAKWKARVQQRADQEQRRVEHVEKMTGKMTGKIGEINKVLGKIRLKLSEIPPHCGVTATLDKLSKLGKLRKAIGCTAGGIEDLTADPGKLKPISFLIDQVFKEVEKYEKEEAVHQVSRYTNLIENIDLRRAGMSGRASASSPGSVSEYRRTQERLLNPAPGSGSGLPGATGTADADTFSF